VLPLHVGNNLARKVNRAEKVQFEGALPFFEAGGQKSFGRGTAGIGDTNVDAAEFLRDRSHEAADGARVGHVESLGKNLDTVLLSDFRRCVLQRLVVARAHRDAAAFASERFRCSAANSLTRRGYESDTVFQAKIHEEGIINGGSHIPSLAGVLSHH